MAKRIFLFVLICLLALALGFLTLTPLQALAAVRLCGYWIIATAFLVFAWYLYRSVEGELRAFRQTLDFKVVRGPAIAVLAASAWMHVHEPHEYKIVMDEVVLGGTAMTMHFERQVAVPVRGYEYGGNFDSYSTFVDKRPLLFPFLVSAVHDLTGYRVQNALWLNVVITPLFMGLVFAVGRRLGGRGAGYAALALVATLPLLAQNFTSLGFECLNLLMAVLALWLGMRLLERPADEARTGAFVLSGVLLAQTRYESALFVVPVAVTVLVAWRINRRPVLPLAVMLAPLFMLPVPWLQNVFKVSKSSWQLSDIEGAEDPFGFQYFYDNVGHALAHYLDFKGHEPNSFLLFGLGGLAAGLVFIRLWREQRELFRRDPSEAAAMIFWLALGAHTLVMLCYFWGRFNDPIVRRLSLPSYLWLLLGVLLVWAKLIKQEWRWRFLTILALAWLAIFTAPAAAKHRWTNENYAARTNAWLSRWLSALPENTRVFAIDPSSTLLWLQHRQSSIALRALQSTPEKFLYHWRQGTWANQVYLIQRLSTDWESGEGIPAVEEDFSGSMKLETVSEIFFTPTYRVRLSRIVEVDTEKFTEAMARRAKLVPLGKAGLGAVKSANENRLENWFKNLP